MTESIRQFGDQLAAEILAQHWKAVHGLLAPWLQSAIPVENVQAFFEDSYQDILRGFGIDEMHYPKVPSIDGNSSTLADLREEAFRPGAPMIPPDVTDANFRNWMNIQLQTSGEQADRLGMDYLADFWLIIVEVDGALRVGYWAHSD